MKKFLMLLLTVLFTAVLFAGDAPRGWTTDINAALAQAKRENKRVLILFTGSDWCNYCIRLKKDVLDKKAFKNLAEENFVPVYFDFPHRNQPSDAQMRIQNQWRTKLQIQGYPTMAIVDADGKMLGKIIGYRQREQYLGELEKYLPPGRGNRSRSGR